MQYRPKLQGEPFDPDSYSYHDIATDREETPKDIVRLHNQRGQVKNLPKGLKDGFGMNWMPYGETHAASSNRGDKKVSIDITSNSRLKKSWKEET